MTNAHQRRTALVTGGGTGIGAATAQKLVQDGCRVIIVGRRASVLRQTATSIGAEPYACDITDATQLVGLRQHLQNRFGTLDVLVNAAGVSIVKPFAALAQDEVDQMLQVNLSAPIRLLRELLPVMKLDGLSVVLVSSLGAEQGAENMAVYAAAKAGLTGLTRSLAAEYGPQGARINAVAPGLVRTPMNESDFGGIAQNLKRDVDDIYRAATAMVPLRRAGRAEEIASVCAFLASPQASYMTGQTLCVDGGAGIAGSIVPNIMRLFTQ